MAYFLEKGFIAYAINEGDFPIDTDIVLPDPGKMANHIDSAVWGEPTPLGGNYNWEGPDFYSYAGISITGATAPQEDLRILDSMLDDRDLSQGKFRQTPNGRYTYIIAE